jgi:hypothetical protein
MDSILILLASCLQNCMTYTIAVCRVKTPDDGQRNYPKHVEFHSKNKFEKLVHLVGFNIQIQCIVCLHSTISAGYFFFQKCRQHFLHDVCVCVCVYTHTLRKLRPNTLLNSKHFSHCTGLLCMRDNTQLGKCIKFEHT